MTGVEGRERGLWALLACVFASSSAGATPAASNDQAVKVQATYTGDIAGVRAGSDPGITYLDNLDVTLKLRLQPLLGWSDAQLFLHGLANQGGSVSRRAGDIQGADNIEAPTNWSLFEAWLEQDVGGAASLLVGLYDINSEFDHLDSADLFINSSQGLDAVLGNSGRNGPSTFPATSLGARLKMLVGGQLYFQGAVLDGVPGDLANPRGTHVRFGSADGALVLFESGFVQGLRGGRAAAEELEHVRRRRVGREGVNLYALKIASGGWWYSSRYPDIQSSAKRPLSGRTNYGGYLDADGVVYREADDAEQGLSAHARVAYGNPRFSVTSLYTGGGLSYTGLIPGRDSDQAGVAASAAWSSGAERAVRRDLGVPAARAEVAFESTYLFDIASWFSTQLDAQYILSPSMDPARDNAVVLIARVQAAF
jgi:porin